MDQQLLTEINTSTDNIYARLPVWKELRAKTEEEIQSIRDQLSKDGLLTFNVIFDQPIGYYFIKSYLKSQHSIDKAIFVRDVDIFKTLNDPSALKEVANKIFATFCTPETTNRVKGASSLQNLDPQLLGIKSIKFAEMSANRSNLSRFDVTECDHDEITDVPSTMAPHSMNETLTATATATTFDDITVTPTTRTPVRFESESKSNTNNLDNSEILLSSSNKNLISPVISEPQPLPQRTPPEPKIMNTKEAFWSEDSNSIGCYGKPVRMLKARLEAEDFDIHMFDVLVQQVLSDLKLDVFPRFLKSKSCDLYLRCKALEEKEITTDSFHSMRMLGRGAFGSVHACKKKDTGRLYAMKQIEKRRVQATDSVHSLLAEKDFLSQMDSIFVTALKYSFADETRLYLVMDLMTGGDLKYHLNHDGIFEEARARFYCAQILLGLEHIHSKGIIYRDLKLENVLVDEYGSVKISDLGLAVSVSDGLVRGYAGTPGYTAPEVVLTQYYSQSVDFFSFGVVIYRSLSGKKPFAKNKLKTAELRATDVERIRKTSIELDRNVVELLEPYDNQRFNAISINVCRGLLNKNSATRLGANGFEEIKRHPWFDCIDWGLLENGYLKPPFIPPCDEIHAEQQQMIGRPPDDDKYGKIRLTQEFEESLTQFPWKSSKVIQSELVECLEKVQEHRRPGSTAQSNDETQKMIMNMYAFPSPHQVVGKQSCLGRCIIV